jgi:hypothetical protein
MRKFTEFDYGITLLCGRFHQDWTHEGTARDVLRDHIRGEQDSRAVEVLRRDATHLAEHLPNRQVETLWTAATDGNFPFPATAASGTEWMRTIEEECNDWLKDRPAPELTHYDTDPGSAHLTDVLTITDTLRHRYGVSDEVLNAVAHCSRTGSPELALRFILRILPVFDTSIDQDFYEQIATLGDSLGFGEFLITGIEYLAQ